MKSSALLSLLCLCSGCWKLDDPAISYQEIPLDNQHVTSEDIVVRTFEPSPALTCPNDEPATFYAVYDSAITTPVPAAVLFHSGAFDYVKNPAQDDPLSGTHYAAEDRLDLSWAQTRVFSTLGMWQQEVDPSEVHTGSLVTAMAQQGVLVLVPSNCWGDLWHNHSGGRQENDYTTERFYRDGLAMASWIYRVTTDEHFADDHGVALPVQVDPDQLYLLGLGDGGRAVSELLWLLTDSSYYDEPIQGVLLDSTPDDLSFIYDQTAQYANYNTGLERIFDDRIADIDQHSYGAYLADESTPKPARSMVIWSSYDTVTPYGTLDDLVTAVEALADADPDSAQVTEVAASAHVFANKDMPLAYEVMQFLFQ